MPTQEQSPNWDQAAHPLSKQVAEVALLRAPQLSPKELGRRALQNSMDLRDQNFTDES